MIPACSFNVCFKSCCLLFSQIQHSMAPLLPRKHFPHGRRALMLRWLTNVAMATKKWNWLVCVMHKTMSLQLVTRETVIWKGQISNHIRHKVYWRYFIVYNCGWTTDIILNRNVCRWCHRWNCKIVNPWFINDKHNLPNKSQSIEELIFWWKNKLLFINCNSYFEWYWLKNDYQK